MNRSYLFIPGDVPRMLQMLDVFDADAVIIDFEDAVALNQKDEARFLTRNFIQTHPPKAIEVYIRINHIIDDPKETMKDLEMIIDLPISGIVAPKINRLSLAKLDRYFEEKTSPLKIIGLVETPDVFFDLMTLAQHPRIQGLMLGAEDLTRIMNIERNLTGDNILWARSSIVYAMHSVSKEAIDTPYTVIHDHQGLAKDATIAANLGFTGKAVIHPNHVEGVHLAFTPTEHQILTAKKIVEYAKKNQSIRFNLDGKMVDKPIIDKAHALLEKYAKNGDKS